MKITTVQIRGEVYLVNGKMSVPDDAGNRHYVMVQEWIAQGNIPEPESVVLPSPTEIRDTALKGMVHDYEDGRVIQVRPPKFAEDESNIRNAIEMMVRLGVELTDWYMADNLPYPVTVEDLRKALDSAQDQGAAIWADFLSDV